MRVRRKEILASKNEAAYPSINPKVLKFLLQVGGQKLGTKLTNHGDEGVGRLFFQHLVRHLSKENSYH